MTRWRKRIGELGCEYLFQQTIPAGMATKTIKPSSLKRVIVDTTVQEKAITYPTDSKLYDSCRRHLVKLAKKHGLTLRQTYTRKSRHALCKVGRYGHGRQFKRMRREIRCTKTYLGRVVRDIGRKLQGRDPETQAAFAHMLELAERLLAQQRHGKNKLYSIHAPEVECIAKGKVHKRYEFGVKMSFTATLKEVFAIGAVAMHGNPYDGHTLRYALDQATVLSGVKAERCFVDKGYRGHHVEDVEVYISGQKRGVNTRALKRQLRRRSAIEPAIGHMKNDGLLGRNHLKGMIGDAQHALLCAAGHNLRLILAKIRVFWLIFLQNLNRQPADVCRSQQNWAAHAA